jgi:hypothetical protein
LFLGGGGGPPTELLRLVEYWGEDTGLQKEPPKLKAIKLLGLITLEGPRLAGPPLAALL